MITIIRGISKCKLCDHIIFESDDIVSFSSFLPTDHKFGKFSDAVFHRDCFINFSDHEKVKDLHVAYRIICNSRPKNLKTIEDINTWTQETFNWPPKNGVVIFQPLYSNESSEGPFYMDEDDYNSMVAAEEEYEKKQEEISQRQKEKDRISYKYSRND